MRWFSPVEVTRRIGAGCHAKATSDANFLVDQDDAVRALVGGAHRTHIDAGGIVALHARPREEMRGGQPFVFDVIHFDPLLAGWDQVHRRTSLGALGGRGAAAPNLVSFRKSRLFSLRSSMIFRLSLPGCGLISAPSLLAFPRVRGSRYRLY